MIKSNNFKIVRFIAILTFANIIATSCSNTQQPADDSTVAAEENDAKFDNKKQEKDAQFLVDATGINLEEIQLGQLAQQKGSIADVKELGKMMVQAHTKSLKEVRAIAQTKQVTVPDSATAKAQDAYAMLNAKSGNDFDKAYCQLMVDGHKDAIKKFEKVSADSRDGEIKDWATTMLPDLRKHLDHVFACQKICEKM
jgi:putative membrane protein